MQFLLDRLPDHKKGFTLIELLIVVAITSIVVGGGIAGYVRFSEIQKVSTTAQEVRDLFMAAKIKAQVHEVPSSPANCELTGYRVYFQTATNRCTKYPCIRPLCGSSTDGGTADGYPSVEIPTGLIAEVNGGTRNVIYPTLNGEVRYANNSTFSGGSIDVNIKNSSGTIRYGFTITNGGAISNVEKR